MLFRTIYQYDVRYGWAGRLVDQLIFRPLMGWATAWSFDRLRRWVEDGVPPEVTLRMALIHTVARGLLGLAWLYHGIVPKLLFPAAGELRLLQQTGLLPGHERPALVLLGLAEALLGLALWRWGRSRWLLALVASALTLLTIVVAITQPQELQAPMNPLTFNLALLGLVAATWLSASTTPSASYCRRQPEGRP